MPERMSATEWAEVIRLAHIDTRVRNTYDWSSVLQTPQQYRNQYDWSRVLESTRPIRANPTFDWSNLIDAPVDPVAPLPIQTPVVDPTHRADDTVHSVTPTLIDILPSTSAVHQLLPTTTNDAPFIRRFAEDVQANRSQLGQVLTPKSRSSLNRNWSFSSAIHQARARINRVLGTRAAHLTKYVKKNIASRLRIAGQEVTVLHVPDDASVEVDTDGYVYRIDDKHFESVAANINKPLPPPPLFVRSQTQIIDATRVPLPEGDDQDLIDPQVVSTVSNVPTPRIRRARTIAQSLDKSVLDDTVRDRQARLKPPEYDVYRLPTTGDSQRWLYSDVLGRHVRLTDIKPMHLKRGTSYQFFEYTQGHIRADEVFLNGRYLTGQVAKDIMQEIIAAF